MYPFLIATNETIRQETALNLKLYKYIFTRMAVERQMYIGQWGPIVILGTPYLSFQYTKLHP